MNRNCQAAAEMSADGVQKLLSTALSSDPGVDRDVALAKLVTALRTSRNAAASVVAGLGELCNVGAGPLSIAQVLGCGADELSSLAGKSLLEVLTSSGTSARVLGMLAEYGECLTANDFPEQVQHTGAAIYCLAMSAAISRCQQELPTMILEPLTSTLRVLSASTDIPGQIRAYANQTASVLQVDRPSE